MLDYDQIREQLLERRGQLSERLRRIKENVVRPRTSDSADRAQDLENSAVVDALGNEANAELAGISLALQRLDSGEYGQCADCGEPIPEARLLAYPLTDACVDCATAREQARR